MNLNDLWTKLKATDPLIEFRTEPKMQMVVSCQRPLDMWNLTGRVYQDVLKKPDLIKVLKWGTYKEGQVMLGNQAAVIKGAPHPNAAKLFIEYLLSKEGTDVFVVGEMMYSFMKDYTPPRGSAEISLRHEKNENDRPQGLGRLASEVQAIARRLAGQVPVVAAINEGPPSGGPSLSRQPLRRIVQ